MLSLRHRGYRGIKLRSQEPPLGPVGRENIIWVPYPLNPDGTSPSLLDSSSFHYSLTPAGPMWAKEYFRVGGGLRGWNKVGVESWPGASEDSQG